MSLLVGITGGMGSGKTLAAAIFLEFGAYILDADIICRKLVEPGQPAFKEISKSFGKNIINKFGNLDRKKLAQVIFSDSKKKKELENILHPRVFEFEKLEYENNQKFITFDVIGVGMGGYELIFGQNEAKYIQEAF